MSDNKERIDKLLHVPPAIRKRAKAGSHKTEDPKIINTIQFIKQEYESLTIKLIEYLNSDECTALNEKGDRVAKGYDIGFIIKGLDTLEESKRNFEKAFSIEDKDL